MALSFSTSGDFRGLHPHPVSLALLGQGPDSISPRPPHSPSSPGGRCREQQVLSQPPAASRLGQDSPQQKGGASGWGYTETPPRMTRSSPPPYSLCEPSQRASVASLCTHEKDLIDRQRPLRTQDQHPHSSNHADPLHPGVAPPPGSCAPSAHPRPASHLHTREAALLAAPATCASRRARLRRRLHRRPPSAPSQSRSPVLLWDRSTPVPSREPITTAITL